MDAKEEEFLKKLRETFRLEAEEHLAAISTGLIDLEKVHEPARRAEILEKIYREAHSLKGAARSVNLNEVESLCQPLESAFAALKRQDIPFTQALFDLFHQVLDEITNLVTGKEAVPTPAADRERRRELIHQLENATQGGGLPDHPDTPPPDPQAPTSGSDLSPADSGRRSHKPAEPGSQPKPPAPMKESAVSPKQGKTTAARPAAETQLAVAETVRIPISKLDPLFLQAEEMVQTKLSGSQRVAELRGIQEALFSWKTDWTKWKIQHPDHSEALPEWLPARFESISTNVDLLSQVFEQDQRTLSRMVDDHLKAMKKVMMLPVSTLVELFPKLVRDLAREQGKQVELVMQGMDLEMDKRVLEELKDPLIHLMRNCIDHGIEKPRERTRLHKAECGTISIAFSTKDSRQVEIVVSDDGAGIDAEKVRAAAIRTGVLSAGAAGKLDFQEALALIFQSGISTSEIITDLSGRGLGLPIVREKAEKLGGTVLVETQPHAGTTFRLLLPLTLATFRGVLVNANEQVFLLPTTQIERSLMVVRDEIQTVENRRIIRLDGKIIPLVKLSDVLEMPAATNRPTHRESPGHPISAAKSNDKVHAFVLILVSGEKRMAVQVDEILAEEEVLVKGMGKQLLRVRNIAGAAVLGSGKVVPVLNINDLMKSAIRPRISGKTLAEVEMAPSRTGRILVAEDSITSRALLKNILETGGYQVTTAVDGVDAYTQLRSGEFDLLVSDVDMPRMSGFELTTKIRADKKLEELPVVLVTALESRQDRERGIDVGANAYIIKSSFDQSNLLEVIQRLL